MTFRRTRFQVSADTLSRPPPAGVSRRTWTTRTILVSSSTVKKARRCAGNHDLIGDETAPRIMQVMFGLGDPRCMDCKLFASSTRGRHNGRRET
jgi:hypothetical protein